ncbi:putative bifunctional diguanylate cyclase/phosphodiesterase [Vallicoccus soli]|uniref:Bifunctional diguanylate cyclase/phosphodiesterase n=1 Tax=Vallicoccus soli TaxID=2339232 RepID=A0A3A3Z8G0_9ACTN|nr:GGDEF domain-containing protein [Vallicoccus soli]RJK97127.1 bifunctional diguanylate cyclase/phosphodiesterase [Vallicoccus soli]
MGKIVERCRRLRVEPVHALVALQAALAGGVLLLTPGAGNASALWWWALLPLFAAAEVLVVHVPTERSSHAHTLREVPAVLGLVFLAHHDYVLAHVLGSTLALLLWARQRGTKLAFNATMFALEASVGSALYPLLLGGAEASDPRGWTAALAAVLVTDLLAAAAVTAAISASEGRYDGQLLREALRGGLVAAMINTCLALLVVVLVLESPGALPLLGAVLLLLVAGYRAYVRLGSGYGRLQLLYRFVGAAQRPGEGGATAAALAEDARELLRADRAELVLLPGAGGPGARTAAVRDGGVSTRDWDGSPAPDDAWWRPALDGEPVLLRHAGRPRGTGDGPAAAPRDGIAVPLRAEGVRGALVVAERLFEEETFSQQDLRLLETLGAHAAVALDRARLVDRLRAVAAQREHEALHDALTGLPNRRWLTAQLDALLRAGDAGALVLLGLDDFRDVNDTLGHSAGDALLRSVADRLRTAAPGAVARLGGDEFAVLLPGVAVDAAVDVAAALAHGVGRAADVQGLAVTVQASAGVAGLGAGRGPGPAGGPATAEALLSAADVALCRAKERRSAVEAYRPEDGEATRRRMVLARDLPRALEDGIEVWFQPQARAADGAVTGAEALLRWEHPRYGAVPPPEVVAVAERTGLLRRLTDRVLAAALAARADWARAGHELDVSVNVTAADVADEGLVAAVAAALAGTATPPARLTVEITESGAMEDPERCLAVLDRLAGLGVRLSVDDFGTGHSSLAYLDRLPVHEVKVDRSFVARLDAAGSDATVVRTTVALAHQLGLQVVAEGVEVPAQWRAVADLGCELVQGYGLARPLPPEAVLAWLDAHRAGAGPGLRGQPAASRG